MFEKVQVIGFLGNDPEMKFTSNGSTVTEFSVAANSKRTVNGQQATVTNWYTVTVWGKLAEITNEHLKKGRKVMVEAKRVDYKPYMDKSGRARVEVKLTADTVLFLDNGSSSTDDAEIDQDIDF